MTRLWRRFWSLEHSERFLLARATTLVIGARLGLWFLPFGMCRRWFDRRWPSAPNNAARIAWAVKAVGRRMPYATCLVEALVAHHLLLRAGLPSEVHIGMRRGSNDERPLEGHAWVTCNGQVVVGSEHGLDRYALLSQGQAAQ